MTDTNTTASTTTKKRTALVVALPLASAGVLGIANGEYIAGGLMIVAGAGLAFLYDYFDDRAKAQPEMPFTAEELEELSHVAADRINEEFGQQDTTSTENTTNTPTDSTTGTATPPKRKSRSTADETDTNEFMPNDDTDRPGEQ